MINLTLYDSLTTSIFIQITTGIIEVISLFVKIPSKFSLLKEMMLLELFVQVIEGSFYIHWFYNFKNISNVTPIRYFDWVITTPTMLINLIFYLIFLKSFDTDNTSKLTFSGLFNTEFYTIITVLILNWVMLLFGYLGEMSIMPIFLAVLIGFIPFLIYYYIIYKKYVTISNDGFKIFFYFLFFWGLYGVAAMLPYKMKNFCYNILDLFSKNFFGIFLTYLILANKY